MEYEQEEIDQAQTALNTHPDASPFWDTSDGQDILECADVNGLRAANTNRERCALWRKYKEENGVV